MNADYLNQKGRIFDIQKFSIHDGPGIRTIIFLKGCIFRCQWCCNPESQNYEIEEMTLNGKKRAVGQDVCVKEVLKKIEQDRFYYQRSGGGVTLSGGECLCQPEFAKALLYACQMEGISTAIETAAGVECSIVEEILPYVDTVLMDIKHMNADKHKQFIGKDNQLTLKNAHLIAHSKAELIIRVPIIPGFNDTKEEIKEIASFASSLKGVKKMHLLPYHRMGRDKYSGLEKTYLLDNIEPLGQEKMEELLEVVVEQGLEGQIGG